MRFEGAMATNFESTTPRWLEDLNPQQRQAVEHGSRSLLILAGAGSGKTRVIVSRIAWMVIEKGFHPSSILAVTFTNRAAIEMRERLTAMAPEANGVMIRTFHSFGAWLLRRNATAAKLSSNFTIYDDDDQLSLLAQILEGTPRPELRMWANLISRAKDKGLGSSDELSIVSTRPLFPEIYQRYEKRLREIGNADFGDLIQLPVYLLQNRPEIKRNLQRQFHAVLVDEYQDTNVAQDRLLRELVGKNGWVAVVGDDDQSIYKFRGAEVGNVLDFPNNFPDANVIRLEQNYRSSGTILDIASAVVANNSKRLGKTLWTDKGTGSKAILAYLEDYEAEARWCAEFVNSSDNFAESAILYRTNAQSRIFEDVFRRQNIPYRIVGTLSFYQREEVKDVLAYLAWISNSHDEVAFRRIANKPRRGLGVRSVKKIIELSIAEYGGDMLIAAENFEGRKSEAAKSLAALARRYCDFDCFGHLGFMIQDLIGESGILEHYKRIDSIENTQRTSNLDELVNAAAEYPANAEGLAAFLELVELDQAVLEEEEVDSNRVTLITMHNTKGLEFDRVVISGMEEGLFPRGDDASDVEELEEERRLFYVAITRARRELAFTCCRRRMIWGYYQESAPSRFLDEIPRERIHVEGEPSGTDFDPWQKGARLSHEQYGVGVVQNRIYNRGHTVIVVLFESGRRATFLPEFSSHQMQYLGVGDA